MEILNYCPDGVNGNFHCSSSFLKATSLICEAQLSFAAHQKYIISFFSLWWMIKGIWALFSLLFIFLWNRKSWLDHFMFIITLECSKLWIWMIIYFRDILLIKISRGANNCVHEWCIYIALYCVLLYTQSALQSCGGSLLNHHQCAASTWMMWRLPQNNGTTHQLQVERRESHRANQVDGDY